MEVVAQASTGQTCDQRNNSVGAVSLYLGQSGSHIDSGVEEQRAKSLDDIPNLPTVRLTMDMEIFSSLGCGRIQLDKMQASLSGIISPTRPSIRPRDSSTAQSASNS